MDIEKFKKFIDSMNESFENPVKINWIKNSNFEFDGEFYVDNIKYIIECSEWGNNVWSYKFSRIEGNEKKMNLVNDNKRKMRVLSTIRSGMLDLLNVKRPDGLIINIIDGSRGRDFVWKRFSLEISQKFNYEFYNQELAGMSTFFLWNKNTKFEIVNSSFNKMLKLFQGGGN